MAAVPKSRKVEDEDAKKKMEANKLNQDIAEHYDDASGFWEELVGDHLHHGFYDTTISRVSPSDPYSAQIRMIEAALRFASISGFKSWRVSEKFFKWTSNQGGFRHNCYTYNAMASTCSAKCFTEGFSYRYGEFKRPTKKRRRKKPGSLSFSFFSVFLLPQPPPLPLSPHKPNHHQSYHNRQLRLEHFSRISASLSTRLLIIMVSKGEGIEKDTTSIDTLRALLHWKQLLTKDQIAVILCHLEKIFPPSFFDIMEHLPIHLAEEAMLAGAVQFRWMFPIERYLLTLKRFVRNRAHPEASIANGYLMEECLNFCSRYLEKVETKEKRPSRKRYSVGCVKKGKDVTFDRVLCEQAHRYILMNSDYVKPFLDIHLEEIAREMPRANDHHIRRIHNEKFSEWFKRYVQHKKMTCNMQFSEEVKTLAHGPNLEGRRFNSYNVNGFRFRTKSYEMGKVTQNSGVTLKAETLGYASRKDKNPIVASVAYYGVLTDIIELSYSSKLNFVLFKCDWIDNLRGKKEDVFKFTLVNFNRLMYREDLRSNEPFILAEQAEQVCYVPDPIEHEWHVVMKMSTGDDFETSLTIPEVEPYAHQQLDETVVIQEDDNLWVRQDAEAIALDKDDMNNHAVDDLEMEDGDNM